MSERLLTEFKTTIETYRDRENFLKKENELLKVTIHEIKKGYGVF